MQTVMEQVEKAVGDPEPEQKWVRGLCQRCVCEQLGAAFDKRVFLDRDVSGKRRVDFLTAKTCSGKQGVQQSDIMSGGDSVRNISNTFRQT